MNAFGKAKHGVLEEPRVKKTTVLQLSLLVPLKLEQGLAQPCE